MTTRFELIGIGLAAVAAGTVYVLVHEARRKRKKAEKAERDAPISKELLLQILNKSADASKAVIDRIKVEVQKLKKQRNLSDEQTHQLFQSNFEHSLDQLIGAIRNQHRVSEKAMDSSFKQHQADPDVRQAIQNMRLLSANPSATPSPAAPASRGAAPEGGSGVQGATLPDSLTRDKLREIMTFNAVTLEKEMRPVREQMASIRAQGQTPQVSPQVLADIQRRISEQVRAKYGCSDEQVMAAVEKFGAREDPAFKDILHRIANTFASALS